MPDEISDPAAALTERLRATHDDPPPEALLAAARAAYSWRSEDTALCRPSYDSLLDEALAPTRGENDARLLRFTLDDLALDVEVTRDGTGRTLVGQVTPVVAAELTVRHGGEVITATTTDEIGRFVIERIRSGPLSIRCIVPSRASTLYTEWVLI